MHGWFWTWCLLSCVTVGFFVVADATPVVQKTRSKTRLNMRLIPSGSFAMGSTRAEREYGYRLDETLHDSNVARTYGWFERETRRVVTLPDYRIDVYPVTNADYSRFVGATSHPAPFVGRAVWQAYGLIHEYEAVQRFLWIDGKPPQDRLQHPVVLISQADAAAYCKWRGQQQGVSLRLPSEAEWEKAARGTGAAYFPWGDKFDPDFLNSFDRGPFDTVPVGQYPLGKSPYDIFDMAGQVFEWTSTRWEHDAAKFVVKGGSWDDLPGVTRAAARHGRPTHLKHILIGFRCAGSMKD